MRFLAVIRNSRFVFAALALSTVSLCADITVDPTANANAPERPLPPPSASDEAVFGMTKEEQAFIRPFLQQLQGAVMDAQDQQSTMVRKQAMIRKLRAMEVDKIDFEEAPLPQVLKNIEALTMTLDPEKKGINFIVTPEALSQRKDVKITLKLTHVPLSEVLKYTLTMADLTLKVDDYAIMITVPKGADPGAGQSGR